LPLTASLGQMGAISYTVAIFFIFGLFAILTLLVSFVLNSVFILAKCQELQNCLWGNCFVSGSDLLVLGAELSTAQVLAVVTLATFSLLKLGFFFTIRRFCARYDRGVISADAFSLMFKFSVDLSEEQLRQKIEARVPGSVEKVMFIHEVNSIITAIHDLRVLEKQEKEYTLFNLKLDNTYTVIKLEIDNKKQLL